jgi:hypothetical protein
MYSHQHSVETIFKFKHIKTNHLLLVTSEGELVFKLHKFETSGTSPASAIWLIGGQVNSRNKDWNKIMTETSRYATQNPVQRIIAAVNCVDNSLFAELNTDCIARGFDTFVYSSE